MMKSSSGRQVELGLERDNVKMGEIDHLRRDCKEKRPVWLIIAVGCLVILNGNLLSAAQKRPNILLAISDDQSYPYTTAYGDRATKTPAFDRIARAGILFTNGFCASPGCSPSRAALLTGRHTWELEHAGTHASSFSTKFAVYPDILEQAGYFVGYTGKGWGPGNWKISGWTRNPAGPAFQRRKNDAPPGISKTDYAANFEDFLNAKPADQPFCFWYGATEPHRAYKEGIGKEQGKEPQQANVPPFLPDRPEIRSDVLDHCAEIDWFDQHLARIVKSLEARGELQNTLIIVTGDNGMPFPRAKANCYEYGIHVPLAISWGDAVPGNRVVDDLVGFVDFAPTILEAAGIPVPENMSGKSLLNVLKSNKAGKVDPSRTAVYAARERHSSSRWNNATYPIRAIRTDDFLYIRNFRPLRWPAGEPIKYEKDGTLGPMHGGYHDIDGCPSLTFLIDHRDDPQIGPFFHLAVDHRPGEELYDIRNDPGNLKNLAADPQYAKKKSELSARLEQTLRDTGDPRILDGGDIWETYPRYSPIRKFPPPGQDR